MVPPKEEIVKDESGNPIYYYFDDSKAIGDKGGFITLPGFDEFFEDLKKNVLSTNPDADVSVPEQVMKYVNTSPSFVQPQQNKNIFPILLGAGAVIVGGLFILKLFKKGKKR